MTWNVLWHQDAASALLEELGRSRYAQRIVEVCERLNRALEQHPETVGESRSGRRRIVMDAPVLLQFLILEDQRKVLVVEFKHYGMGGAN